ncbi:hypothetical protein [Nocardioides sp. Leaf285]|uniref:hypothetical protein n=1 Tax=Nocardioides sp. Leaf285 TaxID=1736322 RepID=UPI00070319A3|nr:hypothetical protein [Nocardioides sp. Leaf285]KQP62832.1 hypothetical protein ASF47_17625 [Nocardioides sp. Leaf285]
MPHPPDVSTALVILGMWVALSVPLGLAVAWVLARPATAHPAPGTVPGAETRAPLAPSPERNHTR